MNRAYPRMPTTGQNQTTLGATSTLAGQKHFGPTMDTTGPTMVTVGQRRIRDGSKNNGMINRKYNNQDFMMLSRGLFREILRLLQKTTTRFIFRLIREIHI